MRTLQSQPARRVAPRTAAKRRGRAPGGPGVVLGADSGSSAAGLLDLQRTSGNRAVSLLVSAHAGSGTTPSIRLHGQTSGAYDGGSSTVLGRRIGRARGCDCPEGDPCLTATGTLQISYRVDVSIVMPPVPGGLNACQERRVRAFLRDVLGPHEREHARRFRTYNGVTSRRFSVTACGRQALDEAVQSRLQQMHDDEANQRATDADALSLAIDPFEREIDLDC